MSEAQARYYDAELAKATGQLFDALKEIERLRKALKEIADDGKNCEGYCRRQAARAIGRKRD